MTDVFGFGFMMFSSSITQQTPAGPMFFWAEPKIKLYLETSKLRVGKLDAMLQTSG